MIKIAVFASGNGTNAENIIINLLVPLAVTSSIPRNKIRTGSVTRDPPPASVFTTPAKRPIPTKIKIEFTSNSISYKIILFL